LTPIFFSAKLQQALSERKEGGAILGCEKQFTAETQDVSRETERKSTI
jgi:hypothetical protein